MITAMTINPEMRLIVICCALKMLVEPRVDKEADVLSKMSLKSFSKCLTLNYIKLGKTLLLHRAA